MVETAKLRPAVVWWAWSGVPVFDEGRYPDACGSPGRLNARWPARACPDLRAGGPPRQSDLVTHRPAVTTQPPPAEALEPRRDLVTQGGARPPFCASSPDGVPANGAAAQRSPARESRCASAVAAASGRAPQPCWPDGRPVWRSSAGCGGCWGKEQRTPCNGSTCRRIRPFSDRSPHLWEKVPLAWRVRAPGDRRSASLCRRWAGARPLVLRAGRTAG